MKILLIFNVYNLFVNFLFFIIHILIYRLVNYRESYGGTIYIYITYPLVNFILYFVIYLYNRKNSLITSVKKTFYLVNIITIASTFIYMYFLSIEYPRPSYFNFKGMLTMIFCFPLFIDLVYFVFSIFPTLYLYNRYIKKIF